MPSPSPSLAMLAALILATPAPAATVRLDPGDAGLVWTEDGFRPVDGVHVREGKHPCPRVGPAWKNMATDQVIRERRCPVPPDAGWRWAEPLGFKPAPVVYASPRYEPPVHVYPPGCCGGGGHVPPGERPPEPPAPVPLPGTVWLMLAALSGLVGLRYSALIRRST